MKHLLACALLLSACYVKHTSVDCTVEWPSEVKVDQLRFTATVDGTIIFGPVARPFDESGGALTSPASLRFDVVDTDSGKATHLFVEGELQNKAVANGSGDFVFAKEKDVAIKVTMTDLHTDCSKCQTCCQDGVCVDGLGVDACGAATESCVVCDPLRADNCSPTGICECGPTLIECAGGQHCVLGTCTCDEQSCATGCCNGNNCETRTLATCGPAGETCIDCGKISADGCAADGSCACGIDPPCLNNLHCVGGACQCDSVSCPDGCCAADGGCHTSEDVLACGKGGSACEGCAPFTCENGECSDCNATICPSGCCNAHVCTPITLTTCTTLGGACGADACDVTISDTCDSTSGTCSCGANPACVLGQQLCLSGQCVCNSQSCTGCCTATVNGACLSGQTDAGACGVGGNICSSCGGGSCNGGVCTNCNSGNCNNGCCTGSVCNGPDHATGCQINGGACVACDSKSDSCNGGQCVCGSGGSSACATGQHCVSGACVCDDTSCSAIGKCCNGNQCVAAAPTTCGSGTGTASASCVNCDPGGTTTDSCNASTFSCQCGGGAGVSCPTPLANLCSNGACVCGNGAACAGPGQLCNGSDSGASCVCDQTLCKGLGGCCSGNVCVTSEATATCGNKGASCSDCRSTSNPIVDTCNAASGTCQCGPGSGVTCPTAIGNNCSSGTCVCGATGAACGPGLKCGPSGTCICDASACGTLKGCCSTNGLSCIQPGSQTPTQCGLAGATCGDCTVGNLANECVTSGGGGGVCKCGSSTPCLASNGLTCNQGSGVTATCGCDATNCNGISGCCSSVTTCTVDTVVGQAAANTACGKTGVACINCTTSSTRSNVCNVSNGTCVCGSTGSACTSNAGLSCTGAGAAATWTCTCDASALAGKCGSAAINGCCSPSAGVVGSVCVSHASESTAFCGAGGASCTSCTHNETTNIAIDSCETAGTCGCGSMGACAANQECSSGVCTCTATSCASGCCSLGPGVANSMCVTSESTPNCGLNGVACKDCTHDTGAHLGVAACDALTGNCECGSSGAACGANLECVGTSCACNANSCGGCCDTGPTCVVTTSENMTQCGDGTAGDACTACSGNNVCDNTQAQCVDCSTAGAGCASGCCSPLDGSCQTIDDADCALPGMMCSDCSLTSCNVGTGTCN